MSERADFLLEIGCEDLPPSDLNLIKSKVAETIKFLIIDSLKYQKNIAFDDTIILKSTVDARLHGEMKLGYSGTSRRIVIVGRNIPNSTNESSTEVYGPTKDQGKNKDGSWSNAAIGFAKKSGVELSQLELKEFNGIEKWYVKKLIPSKLLSDLLPHFINEAIFYLSSGQVKSNELMRRMRWGSSIFYFPRPIRWIVALFGSQVIDFEVAGVRSGNQSVGHRFLALEPFTVTSVEQYLQELSNRYVVLDGGNGDAHTRARG